MSAGTRSTRKRVRAVLVIPCLILVGLIVAVALNHARQSARLDFESGRFSGWRLKLLAPHSGRIVTNPVRRGRYAARFELRAGDDTGDGVRAELKEGYNAPLGREIWYSFSTLVPRDFPIADSRTVITQWHAEEDPGEAIAARSPVLAHRYDGRSLVIDIRYSSAKTQQANDGMARILYEQEGFARGVWHDFLYRVRWSDKPDGLVECWLDGERVINYSGPVGYNDVRGPYFKFGLYHHIGDRPLVVYHDEYRRGFTRESVTAQ